MRRTPGNVCLNSGFRKENNKYNKIKEERRKKEERKKKERKKERRKK